MADALAVVAAVGVGAGFGLASLRIWLSSLEARESRRHQWRLEMLQARGQAWNATALEELRGRVQRLELRGTR